MTYLTKAREWLAMNSGIGAPVNQHIQDAYDVVWRNAVLAFAKYLQEEEEKLKDGFQDVVARQYKKLADKMDEKYGHPTPCTPKTLQERTNEAIKEHFPTPCACGEPGRKTDPGGEHSPRRCGTFSYAPQGGTEKCEACLVIAKTGEDQPEWRHTCSPSKPTPKPVEYAAWMHWRSPELEERLDRLLPLLERLVNASQKHE